MEFSTTDMYLAAYMRMHAISEDATKVGGKVVFRFTFDDSEKNPEQLYREYLENAFLQSYIMQVKEVRGEVYRVMKQ